MTLLVRVSSSGTRPGGAIRQINLNRAVVLLGVIVSLFIRIDLAQVPTTDWPKTEARLSAVLASGDAEQKRTALAEIRHIQTEPASRLAIKALNDKNEMVRATAVSAVLWLRSGEAAAVVLPLLNDKMPFVRREAALALGKIGDGSTTSRLVETLKADKDPEVRSAAAVALGNIGDYASLEPLLSVFNKGPNEDNEFLRRSTARAIGQIFEQVALGSTAVVTPQNFLPPKFKQTDSVNDLARIMNADYVNRVVTTLSNVLRDPKEADDTRREAAYALGATRQPTAVAVLRSQLNSPDPYLAEISKEALLKIENRKQ